MKTTTSYRFADHVPTPGGIDTIARMLTTDAIAKLHLTQGQWVVEVTWKIDPLPPHTKPPVDLQVIVEANRIQSSKGGDAQAPDQGGPPIESATN